MNRHEEIAFTRDIATAVSEELGIPRETVMHHIDFMVDWIKEISKDPKNLSVYLPHIGYMYLNVGKVQKDFDHFNSLPKEDMITSWLNQLERNGTRLEEFNKQFPDSKKYNRHKKKTKIMNGWFTKGMTLKELEEWQNK